MKPFNGKLPTQNTGRMFTTQVTTSTTGAIFDSNDIANLSRGDNWPPSGPWMGNNLLLMDAGNYSGSGTTWTDGSGNNYNATLVGSPTYSSSNGGYFNFDGSGTQYATLPYSGLLNPGNNWTIMAGVYVIDNTWTSPVFTAWRVFIGSSIAGYNLVVGGTDNGGYCLNGTGLRSQCGRGDWANYIRQSNGGVVSNGNWYVVAAVATNSYNNSFSIAYYVNNVYVGAGVWCAGNSSGSNAYAGETDRIRIGMNNNPGYDTSAAKLRIGFVSLYSVDLTAAQMTRNFNFYKGRYGIA